MLRRAQLLLTAAATLGALAAPRVSPAADGTPDPPSPPYALYGLADIDQIKQPVPMMGILGLPNTGKAYDVPTSCLNMLLYMADHGYRGIFPAGDYQASYPDGMAMYNQLTTAQAWLGTAFGTDPVNGTASVKNAFQAYLDGSPVTAGKFCVAEVVPTKTWAPKLHDAFVMLKSDALVNLELGVYQPIIMYIPIGSHMVTLRGADVGPNGFQEMLYRDPWPNASDSPNTPFSQAAFRDDGGEYTNVTGMFGWPSGPSSYKGTVRTQTSLPWLDNIQPGFGSSTVVFMNGYLAVYPKAGWTTSGSSILKLQPLHLTVTDAPKVKSFEVGGTRSVADLALDPTGQPPLFTLEGTNGIFRLDPLSGDKQRVSSLKQPGHLTFAGPGLDLYAFSGEDLVRVNCLNDGGITANDGGITALLPLPGPADALAFDSFRNRLIVLSRALGGGLVVDLDLRSSQRFELPADVLGRDGRLSLSVDPHNGAIWTLAQGQATAYRFRVRGGRVDGLQGVRLAGLTHASSLEVDETGYLIVTCDGSVRTFNDGGRPIDTDFTGMPAGDTIAMTRSFTNFTPDMWGPAFYSYQFPEQGPIVR